MKQANSKGKRSPERLRLLRDVLVTFYEGGGTYWAQARHVVRERWLNDQACASHGEVSRPVYDGNYAAERIVATQDSRPVNLDLRSTAQQRHASHVDAVGHDSVQPWSAGALFPCVIAYVERYAEYPPLASFDNYRAAYGWTEEEQRHNYEGCRATWYAYRSPEERLQSVSYELIAYGRREEYATREDAEQVARALNADAALRAKWQRWPNGLDYVRPHDQAGVS